MSTKISKPKVFISYAWTNKDYSQKVLDFVDRLIDVGIDALLDKYENGYGVELNQFMQKCVSDKTVTNVLMLLNPHYKEKADNAEGGTGIEAQIISAEVYANTEQTKFIPIIFDKEDKPVEECLPVFLKTRFYCDLSDKKIFNDEFKNLVKKLYGEEEYIKPSLGTKPLWVQTSIAKTNEVQSAIISLDNISSSGGDIKQVINEALENLTNEIFSADICQFDVDINVENIVKTMTKTQKYRNSYIEILKNGCYAKDINIVCWEFFEDFDKKNSINETKNYSKYYVLKNLMHELIIYTVAIFLKNKIYMPIGYLVNCTWIKYEVGTPKESSFSSFFYYTKLETNIRDFYRNRDQRNWIVGFALYWKENVYFPYLTIYDLVNADVLITNLCFASSLHKENWFAKLYVYGENEYRNNFIIETAIKLKSKVLAVRLFPLFSVKNIEELKGKIKNIKVRTDEQTHFGYNESFETIDLLSSYITENEVGTLE